MSKGDLSKDGIKKMSNHINQYTQLDKEQIVQVIEISTTLNNTQDRRKYVSIPLKS